MLLARILETPAARRAGVPRWQRVLVGCALLAALLALACPERRAGTASVVLVHDGSASLLTRVNGVNGIERASAMARAAMDAPLTVLEAEDPQRTLANIRAAGQSGVLVTDRPEVVASADAGFIQLAHAVDNAGVTRLSLSKQGVLQVTARQRGGGVTRTLTVQQRARTGGTRTLLEKSLVGEVLSEALAGVVLGAGEIIEARLDGGDALPEDDVAALRLARGPVRVLLGPDAPPSLVRALKAQEQLSFVREDADLGVGVGAGEARKRLRVVDEGAERRVRGVVAGPWAEESSGESMELVLREAPAAFEVFCTLASEPLLVGSATELLLLAEPGAMESHPALPLLVRDVLMHLGSRSDVVHDGVLDADVTAGARTRTDSWKAPPLAAARTLSLAPWFLALVALLLGAWFFLRLFRKVPA